MSWWKVGKGWEAYHWDGAKRKKEEEKWQEEFLKRAKSRAVRLSNHSHVLPVRASGRRESAWRGTSALYL